MEGVSAVPVPAEDDASFQPPNDEQNDAAPLPSSPLNAPYDPQNTDPEASPDAPTTSTRLVKFQLFETKAALLPLVFVLMAALLHPRLEPE